MPPMPNPTCYCAVCQGRKSHSPPKQAVPTMIPPPLFADGKPLTGKDARPRMVNCRMHGPTIRHISICDCVERCEMSLMPIERPVDVRDTQAPVPACGDCGNDGCQDCGGARLPGLVDTSKPLYGDIKRLDGSSYSLGYENRAKQGHAIEDFFLEAEAKAILRAVARWTMCLRPDSHTSAAFWIRCNGGMTGECTPDLPQPSGVGDPHGKCVAPNWNLPDGGCDQCGAVHCAKCVADAGTPAQTTALMFGDLPEDAWPLLHLALAGIIVPEQFTTAGPAVTADGNVVRAMDPKAIAWSMTGILYRALGRATEDLLFRQQPKGFRLAVDALLAAMPDGYQSVDQYAHHPDTSHAEVVDLYNRAMAWLKAGGA